MEKICLPNILGDNIKVIFCDMAAGKESCEMKHHYANKNNMVHGESINWSEGNTRIFILPAYLKNLPFVYGKIKPR
jgi:hypothetical protein